MIPVREAFCFIVRVIFKKSDRTWNASERDFCERRKEEEETNRRGSLRFWNKVEGGGRGKTIIARGFVLLERREEETSIATSGFWIFFK
jgi:hypothetical protein